MASSLRNRLLLSSIGLLGAFAALQFGLRPDYVPDGPLPPFSFGGLTIATLLAFWPLASVLGSLTRGQAPRRGLAALAGCLGLVMAAGTAVSGSELWSTGMGQQALNFAVGVAARGTWALLLLLPWCVAAWLAFPHLEPEETVRDWLTRGACALIAALLIPASYANYLFRHETQKLESQVAEGRFVGTVEIARKLNAAGSNQLINGKSAAMFSNLALASLSPEVLGDAELPRGENARIQYAARAAAFGHFDEAVNAISPLVKSNASAALLMASIRDDQARPVEAVTLYRQAIAVGLNRHGDERDEQLLVQAYSGLAKTLRDLRDPHAAEQAYFDGIRDVPAAEAYFRFQLGRHYALGGRPVMALQSFQHAARLDSVNFGFDRPDVQAQLRPLSEAAPTCVLPFAPRYPYAAPSR